jgi:MoaA/NifB/PqqE/SkfB family radical SAM enzyme
MSLKFYEQGKVLLRVKDYELKTPVFLEVDPSMLCNHSCVWCRYGHDERMLSYDFMVKKLAKYPKVRGVRITGGGEPLINPDTIPFIKECGKRGMTVGIETNGSLLDEESIEVIARWCRYCRISLDAGTPETYEKLHRANDFRKVVDNINKLAKAKVRELGVSYLVVEKNVDDIKSLAKLNLPVNYVHFKPLINKGTSEAAKNKAIEIIESLPYFQKTKARYDRLIQDDICNNKIPCRVSAIIRRIGGDFSEYCCCEHVYEPEFKVDVWDGDTSKCKTCRYNGYNEILESYYKDDMAKDLL